MKIKVNMDLTPEEARTLMGLPDVEPLQQEMVELMREKMHENIREMSDPEAFFKKVFPIGIQSMDQFQRMFTEFTKPGSADKQKAD